MFVNTIMEAFISALLCAAVACVAADIPVNTVFPKLTLYVPEDHAQIYRHHVPARLLSKSTFRDLFLNDIHDTHRHFLTSPVVAISKSTVKPDTFDVTFVPKGLNSVAHDPAYSRLHAYLRTPTEKCGLLFDPAHYFHARLFDAPVSDFVTPSSYKVGDSAVEYPAFFFVADVPEFEKFGFSDIKDIAKFSILPSLVEPEPVH